MPLKTIHLICLHLVTHGRAAPLMESVGGVLRQEAFAHVSPVAGARMIEVRLPYASRDTTLRLAQALSGEHGGRVSAHLGVNAAWTNSVPDSLPDRAHLVDTPLGAREVSWALKQNPALWAGVELHVQPQVSRSRVVLPQETPPEKVQQIADWLAREVGASPPSLNVSGAWLANGSRYHEFVQYRRGALLPAVSSLLWTD